MTFWIPYQWKTHIKTLLSEATFLLLSFINRIHYVNLGPALWRQGTKYFLLLPILQPTSFLSFPQFSSTLWSNSDKGPALTSELPVWIQTWPRTCTVSCTWTIIAFLENIHILSHSIVTKTLWSKYYYYLNFTDEENKVHWGEVTYPRFQNQSW